MTGQIRIAVALLGALALSACSGTGLEQAQMTAPQGSAYDRDLYDGYLALAENEYNEGDYSDSDTFAMRAMEAARGDGVAPEPIDSRELPADKVGELTAARQRLVAAQASGASARKPQDAVAAQIAFDCWMQEQEENRQPDDIAACRSQFMTALASLEEQPKVAAAPPPPAPEPAPEPLPGPYTVLFDFDKADLTVDARTALADMIAAAQKTDYQMINVSGYTDLTGTDAYNDVLSEQRANRVIDFLVESGIEKEKIFGKGYGKADPVVPVDTPEARNRRVEIVLER
ncbi:OmpA family protein [Pelagibius sp.]|uniref:OmpA family protein n=1 Tax=Pelagibius sp. TaxID=1931238 RepID=UPI0026199A57|nr:OmpA family protein [Pelagibius sp.]